MKLKNTKINTKLQKKIINHLNLKIEDNPLKSDIGRYVVYDNTNDRGLFAKQGMVYEIVDIQKHWGYINGKYVSNKIGYRLSEIGNENDFGRVGDVDVIKFVNITEEEAIKKNKEIRNKLNV